MVIEEVHRARSKAGPRTGRDEDRVASRDWRVLHIEDDAVDALRVTLALRYEMPTGSTIDHVCNLHEAVAHLQRKQYDAVLAGLSLVDSHEYEGVKKLIADYHEIPVLILSDDESPSIAMQAGRSGASAFIFKANLTSECLGEALRKAIQGSSEMTVRAVPQRRREARYAIDAPAILFPIQPDGTPGREIAAMTVDVSLGGIGILAQEDSKAVPDICLVGVECRDGNYRYATVEWRHRRLSLPAIRLGGRFMRHADDPFHETRLTPRFDPKELRYKPIMDGVLLGEWTARGILLPQQVDRIKVCPHCETLLTFRDGCPQCGSPKIKESQLIHHFACAHVAPVAAFGENGLACPKCRAPNLVVGADFEYLKGPYDCAECDWSDSETTLIAECMQCAHRFHGREAREIDLYVYYLNRLDPMALIEDMC